VPQAAGVALSRPTSLPNPPMSPQTRTNGDQTTTALRNDLGNHGRGYSDLENAGERQ